MKYLDAEKLGEEAEAITESSLDLAANLFHEGKVDECVELLRKANFVHEAERLITKLVQNHGNETARTVIAIWNDVFPNREQNLAALEKAARKFEKIWKTENTKFLIREAERKFQKGLVSSSTTILKQINMDELAYKLLKDSRKLGKSASVKQLKDVWNAGKHSWLLWNKMKRNAASS